MRAGRDLKSLACSCELCAVTSWRDVTGRSLCLNWERTTANGKKKKAASQTQNDLWSWDYTKKLPQLGNLEARAWKSLSLGQLCNEDFPEEAILFGKAIMELGVLFEQWNSKNECILLCFGFVLPLGAAGFSPCYPILMVSSISASPLFSWFFLWEEGSMNSSFIPLWDTDCPHLSVWCCTLVQELRGGDWGASRDLHLWGRWVEPSLKPLCSEHLQSRAWGDDAIGTAEISPSSAHLKQVRSCGKCSGNNTARRGR